MAVNGSTLDHVRFIISNSLIIETRQNVSQPDVEPLTAIAVK